MSNGTKTQDEHHHSELFIMQQEAVWEVVCAMLMTRSRKVCKDLRVSNSLDDFLHAVLLPSGIIG